MTSVSEKSEKKDQTVPEDSKNKMTLDVLKHPLQYAWSLWFFKPSTRDWQANQRLVGTVETVEDFWSLYNHIKPPSSLQIGCDYSFFKKGVKPMWEDEHNRRGGRWLLVSDKKNRSKECLDVWWLEILLCLIGEAFADRGQSEHIRGGVVQLRNRGDKIALWTDDADDQKGILAIGYAIKERMNVTTKSALKYQSHAESQQQKGSQPHFRHIL